MAEKLKSYTFTRIKRTSSRLDAYLDGAIWRLHEDKDYKSLASTQNALYTRARKLGVKLHTERLAHGLVVQAERTH